MSATDDVGEFVTENSELIGRVLACGNDEARAYALALVANSGGPERVEEVQRELEQIRREMES
jgi:hypothetical protein